jgi:membrane-bound lytic murein transglycosylase A
MTRLHLALAAAALIAGCATSPPQTHTGVPSGTPCAACPVCPVCPTLPEPPKPAEKPVQPAAWGDLPDWELEDPRPALDAFRTSCTALEKQPLWRPACAAARTAQANSAAEARAWFEAQFQPWALVSPDGSRQGLITGYYEPVLKGSRSRRGPYRHPLFAPPEDLVVVDLAELYPELKHLRLRGRLEGRKLVPYYSRAEWARQEEQRSGDTLLWIDDPIDLFFMQIQGSGQVVLDDGSRLRVGYADQNGHPYRSIGKWLVDQGELKAEQASMQGIKAWAKSHPRRLQELLNNNPSLVFFRELPVEGSGPPGALGVALTPERSVAVDPRVVSLGAPIFLATTWPNDSRPLNRLMLAQDTGGAIRGPVRADFYWGSGAEAGSLAGRMRQKGMLWMLLPRGHTPN